MYNEAGEKGNFIPKIICLFWQCSFLQTSLFSVKDFGCKPRIDQVFSCTRRVVGRAVPFWSGQVHCYLFFVA